MRLPRTDAMSMLKGLSYTMAAPSFRLAAGGPVPSASMASGGNIQVKAGDTKLKVVNVTDGNMMGDYLKSSNGETVLLNVIRRNGSSIKTILGN